MRMNVAGQSLNTVYNTRNNRLVKYITFIYEIAFSLQEANTTRTLEVPVWQP